MERNRRQGRGDLAKGTGNFTKGGGNLANICDDLVTGDSYLANGRCYFANAPHISHHPYNKYLQELDNSGLLLHHTFQN